MRVFYGAAIQGRGDRAERADINRFMIDSIKACGHEVVTEHTAAETYEDAVKMLEIAFGRLPGEREERTQANRMNIIDALSGNVDAAIFDVTVPSLGTGIEIAHAYIRPKLGLKEIPMLLLYNKTYGAELSGMVRGMSKAELPNVVMMEYETPEEAQDIIRVFFEEIKG
ncbi:MAG: hypothetical protein JSV63_00940 [Candidatus Aenigmatarchaeota archaeon]|nr:MAG: hypothetical protein JSV63_00940 [Candidatus Aenigmarchaeota archaeon]